MALQKMGYKLARNQQDLTPLQVIVLLETQSRIAREQEQAIKRARR